MKYLKGSITVYLSLSLSTFILVVLIFSRICIINFEKERFEIAADVSFNSTLGEYNLELFNKYDLLYIDTSYLNKYPDVNNLKNRLEYYMKENTEKVYRSANSPWGKTQIQEVTILEYESALGNNGLNMASQINKYIDDSEHVEPFLNEIRDVNSHIGYAGLLMSENPIERFMSYKEAVDSIPLPRKKINNKEVEVEVSNPADWVYGLSGSDIFYLSEADIDSVSTYKFDVSNLISNRGATNTIGYKDSYEHDDLKFVTYLIDKCGLFLEEGDNSYIHLELEYILNGNDSDIENLKAVVNDIFNIRLTENLNLAFSDSSIVSEAYAVATLLEVCTLNPAFIEPVANSVVAACGFIETMADMKALLGGLSVEFPKTTIATSVSNILGGFLQESGSQGGFCYRQYVELLLLMMDRQTLIYRTMDIMELYVRTNSLNENFKMDWCVESYKALIRGKGLGVKDYQLIRKYGYF